MQVKHKLIKHWCLMSTKVHPNKNGDTLKQGEKKPDWCLIVASGVFAQGYLKDHLQPKQPTDTVMAQTQKANRLIKNVNFLMPACRKNTQSKQRGCVWPFWVLNSVQNFFFLFFGFPISTQIEFYIHYYNLTSEDNKIFPHLHSSA